MPHHARRTSGATALLGTVVVLALASCVPHSPSRFDVATEADQARLAAILADPWLAPGQGLVARGEFTSGTVTDTRIAPLARRSNDEQRRAILLEAVAAGDAGWWSYWVGCNGEIRLAKTLPDGAIATTHLEIDLDRESIEVDVRIPSAAVDPEPPPTAVDLSAPTRDADTGGTGADVDLVPAYERVVGQIQ